MNHRPSVPVSNSRIINGTALGFSILFLLASLTAACFVGEWGHVFLDWRRIMISPCPLVTDYLAIGGLSSAFLNATSFAPLSVNSCSATPWETILYTDRSG